MQSGVWSRDYESPPTIATAPAGETRLPACSLHSATQQTSHHVRRVPLTRRSSIISGRRVAALLLPFCWASGAAQAHHQ